jgi:hypothetical protein
LQKLFLTSVNVLKAEWGMANSIGMSSKDCCETGVNLHGFRRGLWPNAANSLRPHTLHIRANQLQLFLQPFIATVEVIEAAHMRFPFCNQSSNHKAH